jgi:hypothetical protein
MIRPVSAALTALAALLTCAAPLSAQDSPTPSVDALVAKLADLKRQRAALDKAEAEVRGQLKAELKRIADLVAALEPDAVPVVPPKPKPPEPVPVDPLRDKVRDAIRASAGDDAVKRRQCLDLAALYRAIVKLLPDADQFGTADQTRQRLRDTANTMLGSDEVLREVRRVVAVELAAVLPTVADAALTDAHRAAAVKVFERLAGILEEAGK